MASHAVQLIGIDVDGTLVRPDQTVDPDVAAAVREATDAGMRVCLATGRSFIETMPVWRQLDFGQSVPEPMVVLGGAVVAETPTGRTLYHKPIPHDLAGQCVAAFAEMGKSSMAIVDAWRWGYDYLVVPSDDFGQAHEGWFAKMPDVTVHRVDVLREDGPEILRINVVVDEAEADSVEQAMCERFGETINVHAIHAPNYRVTVVEVFGAKTTKWTALQYIAQGYAIPAGAIAAVGDDVNDLPMIRGAGVGIAMPDGSALVRDAADRVAEDGLAAMVRSLIE